MSLHSQLFQLLSFLGFSIVLVSLFHRFGLGTILGYLAAGICMGPFGFKIITDVNFTQRIAEFGVVFLLFVIGLELQPRKLWAMKSSLLGFGGLQILFCTVVFSLLGFLGLEGASWQSVVVLGFALSLSSTAFALQSLTERKVLNTQFGQASFAILLMQDVAAIPALAIIPSLRFAGPAASQVQWVGALGILVGLALSSRWIMPFLLRTVAQTRSRDLFTGVTLLIVIGVAYLMEMVGLSMALGAFIAGVFLSESEYRHELEADLEPFKGLLMGLFFVSVGMAVNLTLLMEKPLLIFALTFAYMLIKGLIIFTVGRVMKFQNRSSADLAVFLLQGGEFAFVILGVGQAAEVVTPNWAQMLTLIVTLSMILSPLWIMANTKIQEKLEEDRSEKDYDRFDDTKSQIIIAGFGRVGQVFGRILRGQNIEFTAIEHDPEQIELLRRFGNKVYYGDASRQEILEAAGVKDARYFVIAVDDVQTSNDIAQTLREGYPHLKIFARARNRQHNFDLLEAGVPFIRRETMDSSLSLTKQLLVEMGLPHRQAESVIDRFRLHDELMLQEQFKVRHDQKQFLDVTRQGAEQLAQVLKEDEERTYIKP